MKSTALPIDQHLNIFLSQNKFALRHVYVAEISGLSDEWFFWKWIFNYNHPLYVCILRVCNFLIFQKVLKTEATGLLELLLVSCGDFVFEEKKILHFFVNRGSFRIQITKFRRKLRYLQVHRNKYSTCSQPQGITIFKRVITTLVEA